MLLPNNPEIPTDELESKIKSVAHHRRRDKPLLSKSVVATIVFAAAAPVEQAGWRAAVKKMPLIGPVVVGIWRLIYQLQMPGMTWKQKVRLVPGLGAFALWCHGILRFNAVRAQITRELDELRQQNASILQRVEVADAERRQNVADLANRLTAFDKLDLANRLYTFDKLNLANRLRDLDNLHLAIRMEHLDQMANHLQRIDNLNLGQRTNRSEELLREIDATLQATAVRNKELDNRLAGMAIEIRRKIQQAVSAAPVSLAAAPALSVKAQPESSVDLTSFYVEFEGLFRGSRATIKERLATAYTPYLQSYLDDSAAKAVDVGCGRGEWLELLTDKGIAVTGVDLNDAMVDMCRELGFKAECADAIAYLRTLPENSLSIVSGFHIIEHLPFEALVELFDAALHALRPGGMVIFETPNPENLVVGACNFYYDPTHQHPIVPVVGQFIAQQRGFARAEILRLHPYPAEHQLAEDSEVARRINNALYGPQDYAILAWKTHAN